MFHLFRLTVWIAGVATLSYFGLRHFGYEVNWNYWEEQKAGCQEKLNACKNDLIKTGIDGAKETCDWNCADPKLLIKKQETPPPSSTPTERSSQSHPQE